MRRKIIATFICLFLAFSFPLIAQENDDGGSEEQGGETEETSSESAEGSDGTESSDGEEEKDSEVTGPQFNMTIELGSQTFNEDPDGDGTDEQVTYQSLGLKPDIGIGKVGVGLDLTFHFRFVDEEGENTLHIREEDWKIGDDENFFDVYLPLIRYVRYGQKGDPLYAKLGSIEDGTLGNGFLMGNYANTHLLPERRIVGLAFDLDGRLFDFPYLGVETFVGNLAQFDVIGSRLYTRPLVSTDLPLLSSLQIGGTLAADTDPDALEGEMGKFRTDDEDPATAYSPDESVSMYSLDFFQPFIAEELFSTALYGDVAFQPGTESVDKVRKGSLVGFGGKIMKFINYSLNALFLGENFVPFYFDSTYDLYREDKYEIYSGSGDTNIPSYTGWLANLGFSFLEEAVVFNTSLDGSFSPNKDNPSTLPHLQSTLSVGEGLLPGIYFDLKYDKKYIEDFGDFLNNDNTVLTADINYKAGAAVITLGYTLRPAPDGDWETTAKLSTSIQM